MAYFIKPIYYFFLHKRYVELFYTMGYICVVWGQVNIRRVDSYTYVLSFFFHRGVINI